MTTNLRRALALKQFLNEDFFIFEDKAYEGTLDEAEELFSHMDGDITFEDFLGRTFVEVEEIDGDDYRNDYLVLTDSEADKKWEEALDSYLEECVYDTIPDWIKGYFDEEAWKRDARMDGRGHSLATYDGHEHYETIENEEFYIYKI